MDVRFVNDEGPYHSLDVTVERVPRIGETVIVRGTMRVVVDVVTSIAVDRHGTDGNVMGTVVMTQDKAKCNADGPWWERTS